MGGKVPTQQQNQLPVKRRSYGRACIACHQRKIRCDSLDVGTPCSNCRTQSRLNCRIYKRAKPSRPKRAHIRSTIQATKTETPQADNEETQIRQGDDDDTSQADSSPNTTISTSHPAHSTPQSAKASIDDDQACRSLADFIDQEDIGPRAIGYSTRLYFIGTASSNLNYLVRQRTHQRYQDGPLHFASRQLERKCTAHDHDRIPAEVYTMPSRALADELIEAYFVRVNRGWPIVDEEDFMARYKSRDAENPPGLTLLHAVCLVGAHVLSATRPEVAELKPIFFRRAKLLFDTRFDQNRTTHVQAALLLSWHSDGVEDILANTWHWVGLAVRIAFGLGMHRDSTRSGLLPVYKRTWVRLWWILVQFDVLTSVSHGRPPAINLDDSDVPCLEEIHFKGIPHAQRHFLIYHTKLCKIISRFMKHGRTYKSSPTSDLHRLKEADKVLAEFATQLPDDLRLNIHAGNIWQFTLHLTYNEFIILLHRLPPTELVRFPEDLDICGDAVTAVTMILDSLRTRNMISDLCIFGVNAIFTSVVQVSAEIDSTNPLLAAKSRRKFDSLLLSLRELSRYWLYARSVLRIYEERDEGQFSNAARSTKVGVGESGVDNVSPGLTALPSSYSGLRDNHSEDENDTVGDQAIPPEISGGQSDGVSGLYGRGASRVIAKQGPPEDFYWMDGCLDLPALPDTSAFELFLAGLDSDLSVLDVVQ